MRDGYGIGAADVHPQSSDCYCDGGAAEEALDEGGLDDDGLEDDAAEEGGAEDDLGGDMGDEA